MIRVAEQVARTDTGRQRRANEDNLLIHEPVFVVADGMGGARAGEVASRIAVEAFAPGLPDDGTPEERLAARVQEANERIHELSRSDRERAGMGTTLIAAYVEEEELVIAHVGDSRAYLMRDGKLTALTRDHSLVQALIDQQKLTEEEAAEHPQRSIITRALGPEAEVEVDTRTYRARPGDIVLLCSDGLTSMLPEPAVGDVLRSAADLEAAATELIDAANAAGGRDNITVVLFRLEEDDGTGRRVAVDDPTTVGELHARDVKAAAAAPATAPAPPPRTAPLPDRRGRLTGAVAAGTPRRRRRYRRSVALVLTVVIVVGLVGVGGWLASRSVFFIATDANGVVTIYRGFPYNLPAGIHLYERFYESGVPAAAIPADRRGDLLDHRLRSQHDATSLVDQLEQGKLAR